MTNRRRMSALLLCIGMILVLIVSSAYVAHEAGHNCSGDDCPICQMIAVSTNLLRIIGLAVLLLALFMMHQERSARQEQQGSILPVSGTLVSWKIRLND